MKRTTNNFGNNITNKKTDAKHNLKSKQIYSKNLIDFTNRDVTNSIKRNLPTAYYNIFTSNFGHNTANNVSGAKHTSNKINSYFKSKNLFNNTNREINNKSPLTFSLVTTISNENTNKLSGIRHTLKNFDSLSNSKTSLNHKNREITNNPLITSSLVKPIMSYHDLQIEILSTKMYNTLNNLNSKIYIKNEDVAKKVPNVEVTFNFFVNYTRKYINYNATKPVQNTSKTNNMRYVPTFKHTHTKINKNVIEKENPQNINTTEAYQSTKGSEDENFTNELEKTNHNTLENISPTRSNKGKYRVKLRLIDALIQSCMKALFNNITLNSTGGGRLNKTQGKSNLLKNTLRRKLYDLNDKSRDE